MANGLLPAGQPTDVGQIAQGSASLGRQMTDVEMAAHAKASMDRHILGLQKKRMRDLTAEKYLMHVDGENDGQYAEIVDGWAVIVEPKNEGAIRWQRNLLRPLMDNTVAYHTSIPHRVVAESPPGRRERDRARMDTLLGNHLISINNLNSKLAQAMYIAGVYGYCGVHGTWRQSSTYSQVHPLEETAQGRDGWVDFWVGDPWGTVFDDAATRGVVHRVSYEVIVPTDLLRMRFQGHPEVARIRGRTDLPSSSRFQRIVRRWQYENQHLSGSAVINVGGQAGDELTSLIVEEIMPGVDPNFPAGRLQILALHDSATIDTWSFSTSTSTPVLLHIGPLPAGRGSMVPFYSVNRFDDVYGKPYVADLSPLQQQLNQIVSMRAERLKRYSTPQLMAKTGAIEDDAIVADPDYVLTVSSSDYPVFLNPPQGTPDYDALMADTHDQMFRIGGWQAASRGESYAGDAAAKVVALSKADDTVFGPMNKAYQDSVNQLLQLGHGLFRTFSQMPVMAKIAGNDLGYIADPWIRKNKLSQEDPNYSIVSGFGSTPESLAQSLFNLVTTRSAEGAPLISTEEFWEKYPDPSLRPHMPGSGATKRMRLNAINYHIETLCSQSEEEYRDFVNQNPKVLPQLATFITQEVNIAYPILRTDNPNICIASLDELVHDITSSSLTRMVAEMRQAIYFQWLMEMAMSGYVPMGEEPPEQGGQQPQGSTGTPRATSKFGGTRTSELMSPRRLKGEVDQLTSAANAGEVR